MSGEFRKYMHVERFGNDEVQGIELGTSYVFPKIDGTNSSTWVNDQGHIQAGSRNRHLSIGKDNAGFLNHVQDSEKILKYHSSYPHHRLYGEWLVPHSLKTYRDDAWRTFYVFDVYDDNAGRYLTFDEYAATLDIFNIQYLQPLAIITNGTYENFLKQLEKNTVLIRDGEGSGEGIVIKNYQYKNKYGRQIWAKMVTTVFKERHVSAMGKYIMSESKMVEQEIVDEYVTQALVDKIQAKITLEEDGWNSRCIPRLLQTVYHDLVTEEIWGAVKKFKNPTINFKTLGIITTLRIKELKPEVF